MAKTGSDFDGRERSIESNAVLQILAAPVSSEEFLPQGGSSAAGPARIHNTSIQGKAKPSKQQG
jgi:hypothetical protein